MVSSSTDTTATLTAHPRLLPRPVYDPYKAPDDIAPLFEAANTILTETPDPQWWSISDEEVVAMAFPDWEIVRVEDHPPACRCRIDPLAILRHRTDRDRWLLLLGHNRLCHGRGGTMGQFFRFKYHSMHTLAAVGTVDEVMARLKQWRHTTSWGHTPRLVAVTIRDHCMPTAGTNTADMTAAQSAAVQVAAIDMLAGLVTPEHTLLTNTTPRDR